VCGPDFRPTHRWKHFQGNFWWARCSYVRMITSPVQTTIEGVQNPFQQVRSKNKGTGEGLQTFVPSGRFLAEWWLCSSPKKLKYRYSKFSVMSCHNPRRSRRRFRYSGSRCNYMGYSCLSQPNFLQNWDVEDILRYKQHDPHTSFTKDSASTTLKEISNPQFWSCQKLCTEAECSKVMPIHF